MIYFMQEEGTDLVKIGHTRREGADRVDDLQTGNPRKLIILATIEGGEQDEARWQKEFASDHVRGEWFRMSWRLCLAIARAEARHVATQPREPRTVVQDADWWEQILEVSISRYPILAVQLRRAKTCNFVFIHGILEAVEIDFPDSKRDNALACTGTDCQIWLRRALKDVLGIPIGPAPSIEISTESECVLGRVRGLQQEAN